ncbi:hypothetical protein [Aestuariivirga sp.]|uniref:hypothetical protein n=1 Tax=Aestuariivirga sp. TaxID=2650926 RepID=UPI003BAA6857
MKLVEVVMLIGAHCVSPVEHSQLMTEAAKVQCAAVVEKDTELGTVNVIPAAAAVDPKVIAVITRFNAVAAEGAKIVPAFAPAGSPPSSVVPPRAAPQLAPVASAAESDAPPAPEPEPQQRVAAIAPAPAEAAEAQRPVTAARPVVKEKKSVAVAPPKKQQMAAAETTPDPKVKAQCKGEAIAKWYKAADGHRKYRCVRPEPASDTPTAQLY